ncbi:MAG: RNA 2',3'-cyclic phosphodiesterase [Burkholderiales bacterium]
MPEIGKQGAEDLNTTRVFFAQWPNDAVRGAFSEWAKLLGQSSRGRLTRPGNLHLTLVFLGDIPLSRLGELDSVGAGVSGKSFHLDFTAPGYWRHNRIVWAAPVAIPPPLSELAQTLEAASQAADFRFDRRPYLPHVTLLRDVRREPDASLLREINWQVNAFVLVRSRPGEPGTGYEVIGRWPLS